MKEQKSDLDVIKPRQHKRNIAIILIALFIVAFIIRLTPLVQIYEINFITLLVWQNGINIFLISGVLIYISKIERKIIQEKIEKLADRGVDI